jgi:hypothetical protein
MDATQAVMATLANSQIPVWRGIDPRWARDRPGIAPRGTRRSAPIGMALEIAMTPTAAMTDAPPSVRRENRAGDEDDFVHGCRNAERARQPIHGDGVVQDRSQHSDQRSVDDAGQTGSHHQHDQRSVGSERKSNTDERGRANGGQEPREPRRRESSPGRRDRNGPQDLCARHRRHHQRAPVDIALRQRREPEGDRSHRQRDRHGGIRRDPAAESRWCIARGGAGSRHSARGRLLRHGGDLR